jgi:hypothetical protein
VVNASRITGAVHFIPAEPNCTGVVQRAWVVNSHIDLPDLAAASRVSGVSRILSVGQPVCVCLVWVLGVSSGFLRQRVYLALCGVWVFGSAVLYPIRWFFCNISGTRVCSLHVGFALCHSWNAIRRPCARSWNIDLWAFSIVGETHRLWCLHAGCFERARSRASHTVHGASTVQATRPTEPCVRTGSTVPRRHNPLWRSSRLRG